MSRLFAAILTLGVAVTPHASAADQWSAPAEVHHDTTKCVTYRARLSGDVLVIQAAHESGWHTNSMDNEKRATEKLAGKKALGVDKSTSFILSDGLEPVGPWYQSPPKDNSKPELLWFTWIFEGQATFATKIRRTGQGPAHIQIRGQACSESVCKNIEAALSLPIQAPGSATFDFKLLVPVR